MDDAAQVKGLLDDQRGRGAEAVEAQPKRLGAIVPHPMRRPHPGRRPGGPARRPTAGLVADDPAAQQWGGFGIGEGSRQPHGDIGPDGQRVGIAAVAVPTGERGPRAQVLSSRAAEGAGAIGPAQRRDPGAVTDLPVRNPAPRAVT